MNRRTGFIATMILGIVFFSGVVSAEPFNPLEGMAEITDPAEIQAGEVSEENTDSVVESATTSSEQDRDSVVESASLEQQQDAIEESSATLDSETVIELPNGTQVRTIEGGNVSVGTDSGY